eukprot:3679744-Amphidinium_carterae.1
MSKVDFLGTSCYTRIYQSPCHSIFGISSPVPKTLGGQTDFLASVYLAFFFDLSVSEQKIEHEQSKTAHS